MLFCPFCSTKLILKHEQVMTYHCVCCPYHFFIDKENKRQQKVHFFNKQTEKMTERDETLVKGNANEHVSSIDSCPNRRCDSQMASFVQMQIRSGDEPMTTIYTCVKCGETWRID